MAVALKLERGVTFICFTEHVFHGLLDHLAFSTFFLKFYLTLYGHVPCIPHRNIRVDMSGSHGSLIC